MDPLFTFGVILLAGAVGYYVGRLGVLDVLRPLIHQMSERIKELESRQVQQVMADDQDGLIEVVSEAQQVEILEKWIRK